MHKSVCAYGLSPSAPLESKFNSYVLHRDLESVPFLLYMICGCSALIVLNSFSFFPTYGVAAIKNHLVHSSWRRTIILAELMSFTYPRHYATGAVWPIYRNYVTMCTFLCASPDMPVAASNTVPTPHLSPPTLTCTRRCVAPK